MCGNVLAVLARVPCPQVVLCPIDRELPECRVESHRQAADGRMPMMEPLLVATTPVIETGRKRVIVHREPLPADKRLRP